MREQGVDHPGLGGEMLAQQCGPPLVPRPSGEQSFELDDVAVDGLLEVAVSAIFAGDFIEGLLAGRRVEPLGERLALAALIAIPHLGGEIAIHQPSDVERQRLQRIATTALLGGAAAREVTVAGAGIGAVQEIGKPSIASLIGTGGAAPPPPPSAPSPPPPAPPPHPPPPPPPPPPSPPRPPPPPPPPFPPPPPPPPPTPPLPPPPPTPPPPPPPPNTPLPRATTHPPPPTPPS